MSLSVALTSALSGLRASQDTIGILSNNIANANNEDYSRQVASQSAVIAGNELGSGVRIEEVERKVDQFITRTVVTRTADVGRAEAISNIYDEMQLFLGQPGQGNSIDIIISDFFDAITDVSLTPERTSLRFNAVNAGATLATELSSLASSIEDLRLRTDQLIEETTDRINTNITSLQNLNISIQSATATGSSTNALFDERDAALKDLAEDINISYFFNNDDTVTIYTGAGTALIEAGSYYQLDYNAASSIDDMINDIAANPINTVLVSANGTLDTDTSFELVTGGVKSEVTTTLTGGKIKGYLEIRDSLLPDVLDSLDALAQAVRDEVNVLHNNGVGFPPPTNLTGTTLVDPAATTTWTGEVLIAPLDADGTPVNSKYASQIGQTTGFTPLTLDLSTIIDDGGVSGTPTHQAVIDEINHHFGVPQNRVGIGDIHNIELVAKSDSLAAGAGSFDFNLETTNLSANDATYRITGVTTSDAAIVVTTPGAFPTSTQTNTAGNKSINTGLDFTLDVSAMAVAAGPYTINVAVEVDDGLGGTFTSTISYVVAEDTAGMYNDRYAATAATVDGTIEAPTDSQFVMQAILVDENGTEVAKDANGDYTLPGYLKLVGNETNDVRVGISELTSNNASNSQGFSHFYGLNNLFTPNNGALKNSAVNMAVESSITAEPSTFAAAQLALSGQPADSTSDPRYTYEISNGGNGNAIDLVDLQVTQVAFVSAGGIPALNLSISDYAAEVLGYSAAVNANANEDFRKEELILSGFIEKDEAVRGVNMDEELANTVLFQNAYSANARIITVVNELFDDLLSSF